MHLRCAWLIFGPIVLFALPLPAAAQAAVPAAGPPAAFWLFAVVASAFVVLVGLIAGGIRRLSDDVRFLADRDALTGLMKPAAFRTAAIGVVGGKESRRDGRLFLAMIDLDDLAGMNDAYGTATVDEALRLAARSLENSERTLLAGGTTAGRFMAMLCARDEDEARRKTADLVQSLTDIAITYGGTPVNWTFGAGVCPLEGSRADDVDAALESVEDYLRTAKASGRGTLLIGACAPRKRRGAATPRHSDELAMPATA